MSDLIKLSITEALKALRNKEFTAVELVRSHIEQSKKNKHLNIYITETFDKALSMAKIADQNYHDGKARKLEGIPVGVKDLFCTKGVKTTAGSRMLSNFVPTYESTISQNIENSGTIMIGKTNMDEFAMGSSNENSAFGDVLNPWDRNRVPGGSSGGSAAAVAGGHACCALGTDTGGSIRQPASLCGIVGLKPTYGSISRYGMIAFASSLDQCGPLTRTVADAALLLGIMQGQDPRDSTSVGIPGRIDIPSRTDLEGLRFGVPSELVGDEVGIEAGVGEVFDRTLKTIESLGGEVAEITLPHARHGISAYYVLAPAEASSNLARYDGVRYGMRVEADDLASMYEETRSHGFGPEVKRRIMLGTYALSSGYYDAYYAQALKVRRLILEDFNKVFAQCDVLAGPTSPTAAFKLGEKSSDPLSMYLSDIYTISCNLAGIAGISIPCGFTASGLPIGLQLQAPAMAEETLLRAARMHEKATDWHTRRPAGA